MPTETQQLIQESSHDLENDKVKSFLLSQLPQELQKRWREHSLEEIQEVVNERKEFGIETVIGYHCSDADLPVGSFIKPGSDNMVHYATDLKKLYGKRGKFLYILEGSNLDRDNDTNLGWKTSFSSMKIVDKISLTHKKSEEIGAGFAKCEYV